MSSSDTSTRARRIGPAHLLPPGSGVSLREATFSHPPAQLCSNKRTRSQVECYHNRRACGPLGADESCPSSASETLAHTLLRGGRASPQIDRVAILAFVSSLRLLTSSSETRKVARRYTLHTRVSCKPAGKRHARKLAFQMARKLGIPSSQAWAGSGVASSLPTLASHPSAC